MSDPLAMLVGLWQMVTLSLTNDEQEHLLIFSCHDGGPKNQHRFKACSNRKHSIIENPWEVDKHCASLSLRPKSFASLRMPLRQQRQTPCLWIHVERLGLKPTYEVSVHPP